MPSSMIERDIDRHETGGGSAQAIIGQGGEFAAKQRSHHPAENDPDDSGEQPAREYARPVDFAHAAAFYTAKKMRGTVGS